MIKVHYTIFNERIITKEKIMFEEVPKNCRYAYARVSSKSQEDNSSLETQKEEFLRLGVSVKNIRVEVGSAADKIQDRPIFYHLIDDELKENDLLLVTKIDRCSRNTLEFLKLQERLHKKGVTFLSLDLPYSNDIAVNQLIATNLAAIATFENERRKERQREGIKAARKAGQYLGRKTVIDKKLISQVQDLKENKNLSITEISKITGRARNTIYKILKEELNYIPYNRLVKNKSEQTD
jgi:DNA invertase Pin-like site-specific DNA recombinase